MSTKIVTVVLDVVSVGIVKRLMKMNKRGREILDYLSDMHNIIDFDHMDEGDFD